MWVLPSVVPRLGFIPFGAVPPPSTLLNINFDSFGLYHSPSTRCGVLGGRLALVIHYWKRSIVLNYNG